MFNFEFKGFEFKFDESNLWLTSNILNLHPDQDKKLLATIGHLQDHMKFLLAMGYINTIVKELQEVLESAKRERYIASPARDKIRHYRSAEQTVQIELWYSYIVEKPAFPIMPDSDVWRVWDLIDEATNLLDRFTEYQRLKPLSQRFPTAHDGYVYLFRLSTGHYKIGFSNNPQRRGREITSGLPLTLDLIHQIPSNQIACLEHELHEQYKNKRHGTTEWFELSSADVEAIKAINERRYPWLDNPEWGDEFRINFIPVRANLFLPPKPLAKPESDILAE